MTSLPIIIPDEYEIVVKKDDKVQIGQVLAQKKKAPEEVIIPIADLLGVSPKKVGGLLKKAPGDFVDKGDVLAVRDGLFGDKVVTSNVRGTLSKYERNDGTIVIRFQDVQIQKEAEEILCPLDGVVSLCHNGKIVLETQKNVYIGETGTGQTARGVLKFSEARSKDPITAEKIHAEFIETILFGPAFTTEAYAKASAIGIGGILTLELDESDISYINEKRLSLPVIKISEDIGKTISKWKNKEVFIDGESKSILLLSYEKSTR